MHVHLQLWVLQAAYYWKSHDILVEVLWCVSVEEAHAMNHSADRKDCWDTCEDLKNKRTTLQKPWKDLQAVGINQTNNANIYSLFSFPLCVAGLFPTGYDPKFCKLVGCVTNVHRYDYFRPHERRAMQTNQSTPEPKKDEDVTVLALL